MAWSRRVFVRRMLLAGFATLAAQASAAVAAILNYPWPQAAFAAKRPDEALARLIGKHRPQESSQITLTLPDIAEDGAVVPVSVATSLPDAESIILLAEKNPTPLLAEFLLTPDAQAYVSTHVKLGASGAVVALVRAQGRYYAARKTVKVTVGGCG